MTDELRAVSIDDLEKREATIAQLLAEAGIENDGLTVLGLLGLVVSCSRQRCDTKDEARKLIVIGLDAVLELKRWGRYGPVSYTFDVKRRN